MALGVAWVLDGLEITVASAVAGILSEETTLGLSSTAVGAIATVYLAGEVVGALFFGRLSEHDRPAESLHRHVWPCTCSAAACPLTYRFRVQPAARKVGRCRHIAARRNGGGPSRRASHAPAVRSGR